MKIFKLIELVFTPTVYHMDKQNISHIFLTGRFVGKYFIEIKITMKMKLTSAVLSLIAVRLLSGAYKGRIGRTYIVSIANLS